MWDFLGTNMRIPVALISFLAIGVFSLRAKASTIDFQSSEIYPAGIDIADLDGWTASSPKTAHVSEKSGSEERWLEVSSAGSVDAKIVRTFKLNKSVANEVMFYDFCIKPIAERSEHALYSLNVGGARIAFLADKGSDLGYFAAVADEKGALVATNEEILIDENGQVNNWIRLTVRSDLKAGKWDFFVNGKLVLLNQPNLNIPNSNEVVFYPSSQGNIFVDNVQWSNSNPVFPDADSDAIPDVVEIANGTDMFTSDRGMDRNSDGKSNVENFIRGESLTAKLSSGISKKIVYVDNKAGNDRYKGDFSYRVSDSGPKASLKNALQTRDKDAIIVLIGTGTPYVSPTFPRGTAPDATLSTVGDVTIITE